MDKTQEALKLALEALKMCRGVIRNNIENLVPIESPNPWFSQDVDHAITAIRDALAEQPAQQKHEQRKLVQVIAERDYAELVIDALCDAVLGDDRPEWSSAYGYEDAIGEVEERMDVLVQPAQQQEPVAYASDVGFDDETEIIPAEQKGKLGTAGLRIPLYIDPPAIKPWAELSVDEMVALVKKYRDEPVALVAATEAKLKEKNA